MSLLSAAFVALLVAGAVFWLMRGPKRRRPGPNPVSDPDALEEAEEEVRGLNAFATPEDAEDDLPDWGPGAPRP